MRDNHFTAKYLCTLPTLQEGHFDNLKINEPHMRVWLSRMTVESGMPYNNQVTIEMLVDGQWVMHATYKG